MKVKTFAFKCMEDAASSVLNGLTNGFETVAIHTEKTSFSSFLVKIKTFIVTSIITRQQLRNVHTPLRMHHRT